MERDRLGRCVRPVRWIGLVLICAFAAPHELRSDPTGQRLTHPAAGNWASEAAVARGLKWLAEHEAPDGHWSLDRFERDGRCNCTGAGKKDDVAGTAFGVLPFLAAGRTHKSTDHNPHVKNVERALKYLLLKQQSDGDFGGGMSAHGLASVAVCEAYGLTSDPALKGPA
ncbi:MAG TPA: hypothetical protein VG013_18945, partial [Gemmataceae bacterium]|nr:hypothetical protein [Gemmataceae bacterium]